MEYFEQYLQGLSQSFTEVNWVNFVLNLIVTALLATGLSIFYVRFGNSVSNRKRFAKNFLPLALTTMLIIFIVKSSVALSLGLVGALSIVRFRAAIKDPEELTYLFLTIGLGLAAGANEILIAICAFVFIVAILFVQSRLRESSVFKSSDNMHLNLSTSNKNLKAISDILSGIFPFVELRRVDESENRLDLAFIVDPESIEQIESARAKLQEFDKDISISFIEQRHIAV